MDFPSRYGAAHIAGCIKTDGNRVALEYAQRFADGNAKNLWFYGAPGSGKTHIAAAAAAEGPIGEVRFISVPRMLLEFQASVRDHQELELLDAYESNGKVKLFDDLGAHRMSDFSIEMFGMLIDRFYSNDRAGLIFTSNLSPKELLNVMGERISSRLVGLADAVKIEGSDFRLQKNPTIGAGGLK